MLLPTKAMSQEDEWQISRQLIQFNVMLVLLIKSEILPFCVVPKQF